MTTVIYLDTNKWNIISKAILTSKKDFEYTLITDVLDSKYINNNIEIVFPNCLSKNERHIIHRYSSSNRLYSHSECDEHNKSELHTYLYRSYIYDLFVKYNLLIDEDDNKDEHEDNIENTSDYNESELDYSNDEIKTKKITYDKKHIDDLYKEEVSINNIKHYNVSIFTNQFILGVLCGICLSEFIHSYRKLM